MNILTIGAGNMADALLGRVGQREDVTLYTYTPSKTRAKVLAEKTKGVFLEGLDKLPPLDYIFLSFKPQNLDDVSKTLKEKLSNEVVVVSLLAGVSFSKLEQSLGTNQLIRVMPNTPSKIGLGLQLILGASDVCEDRVRTLDELLKESGRSFFCKDEDQLDRMTAYTGSGPAFIFEFARLLADDLSEFGVSADDSKNLIKDLFLGSAQLMTNSVESFDVLRNNVTSKGGTTYESLKVFEERDWKGIIREALEANYRRNKELSK